MSKTNSEATGIELFVQGELYWCKVHEPDDRYKKYSVDVVITPEEASQLNAQIADILQAKKSAIVSATKRDPNTVKVAVNTIKQWTDKDKKPVDGKFLVHASRNALDKEGNIKPGIPVFDANKQPITSLVGNGSKGKLKFTFNICDVFDEQFGETKVYASLRPVALQVTDLKEFKKPIPKIDPTSGF